MQEQEAAYLDVKGVLNQIGVSRGDFVGDLGCGSGYFTFPAALQVGSAGKVFAVDVQKHVIENIERQSRTKGLQNVYTVWTDLEIVGAAKQLANGLLDYTFLVNILFQSQKRSEIIKEAIRMTKDGGKLLVIDWLDQPTPFGPQLDLRVVATEITKLCQDLGLTLESEIKPGQYHWGLLFSK